MNWGCSTGWFRRWGWIFRPVHPLGFLVTLGALAFLLQVFLALDARAHSVSDLLDRFYVYAAPTFLGLMWIGERTSGEKKGDA
jgi:hypothetical protein